VMSLLLEAGADLNYDCRQALSGAVSPCSGRHVHTGGGCVTKGSIAASENLDSQA
jgi:hypothetical protein